MRQRLERHRSRKKKLRWHVDYLLRHGKIADIRTFEVPKHHECGICQYIVTLKDVEIPAPGFGASDCNCAAHLLFFKKSPGLVFC